MAEAIIAELNIEQVYPKNIITEVTTYGEFYKAEDYHQNYFENNPEAAYCQRVIKPKLDKFKKVFKNKVKPKYK